MSNTVAGTSTRERRCACGRAIRRFWSFCPECGRRHHWRDDHHITGFECVRCGWIISDTFSHCPWCGADVYEEGHSSDTPLKAPRGFRYDAPCDWGCGGGVQYPMVHCPWCGRDQEWEEAGFEGSCPHCARGVDDEMHVCPWCGNDATGQDLIPRALRRVRRLLLVSRIRDWGYRVLLRPGISGVDPSYPKIVEIEQDYVVRAPRRAEIPWTLLVGLICHELGHSFLYHHWGWTRHDEFIRVFGQVDKAYRVRDNAWVDFQRRKVSVAPLHHVTAYAATHPQEDFAETFRFYVTRGGRLRELFGELGQRRKEVIVYEKFLALHRYVRLLRGWR